MNAKKQQKNKHRELERVYDTNYNFYTNIISKCFMIPKHLIRTIYKPY